MGAVKIWNAMEVAEEAQENGSSEILSSSLTVDHTLSLPQMTPPIIELCKDLFKKWSELDNSHFSVETVSGGITNLLLKVSVREENGNIVNMTVRLYGPNTEYVINRERELQAIRYLSAAGFGAKLLGVFGNGMVQSFINARTLTPPGVCFYCNMGPTQKLQFSIEMAYEFLRVLMTNNLELTDLVLLTDMSKPKLAAEIAKQLRKFHQVEIPGSKEPQLWNDAFKFFQKASTLTFHDSEKQRIYETISFESIHAEVFELKELTGHLDAPVVFAHNDLLSGNLMLNDEEEKLYFIDFEYGSYNYRGFDIGNHFNEYAGYDCDYSLYPSKEEQYHFFRHYLDPEKAHEVSDKDLEALYIETNTYMLASHLYWALWALIQAKMSPIDFDYLGYFFLRYNEYKKQKEMCFSLAQSYLSRSRVG
ncbi:hypothetical protein TEA_015831 [Camellia sinensis var. sinensis]|uniref:ethanolamine kinase n=1 Tax=Camellia sinensis var. sinensis TaxID=542762 RepID=A0A4S4E5I6_CAMSN|nr:hypothetical protein TEA_015831 [Camellia sinensis var. sinensis]